MTTFTTVTFELTAVALTVVAGAPSRVCVGVRPVETGQAFVKAR